MKSYKQIHKFFSENLWYAKLVFVSGGIGIGILMANPLVGEHPVRWAAVFFVLAALGYLYPLLSKTGKKK